MLLRAVCSARERRAKRQSCFHGSGVESSCSSASRSFSSSSSNTALLEEAAKEGSGWSRGVFGGCVGKVWYLLEDDRRLSRRELEPDGASSYGCRYRFGAPAWKEPEDRSRGGRRGLRDAIAAFATPAAAEAAMLVCTMFPNGHCRLLLFPALEKLS